jgi:acyl-CoA synthetase (AMP-forming)/AMP-acid ligase II
VINRGGEIISPFEIEEAMLTHPAVLKLICFSTPHNTLQEGIGIAILCREGHARPDLRSVQAHVVKSLHPSKWPQVLVYMDRDVPRGPGSGKPLRCGARSRQKFTLDDAIEFHAFAPLEALACVGPMAFLSDARPSDRFTL